MKSIDPTTEQVIETYPEHSQSEMDHMVQQAKAGFEAWHRLPIEERAARMMIMAKVLTQHKSSLTQLMAREMGKPLKQGEAEIEKCVWVCEFFAEQADEYLSNWLVSTDAKKSYVRFEPLGVILAVMPWNFPFWQVFRAAAPIMIAGNTIVLKHASNVCGVAVMIEALFRLAGFPDGSLRSVLIKSEQVAKLIANPLIRGVTVTGSVGAGKAIASAAGAHLKKTVLELGGSDPYLILADADLEEASESCVASRLINGGQSCVSAKRFIVVEEIKEKFEHLFVEKMRRTRMGSPFDEGVTLGPLARRDLRDQLHAQVQQSLKLGGRAILGGVVPERPGAFYPPTVLTNVKPGMPAYHDEFFGPVASIINVKDEEEAVRVANDTAFGLGAAVFTKDLKRGERIAHELQAGCCFVNDYVKSDPRLPFGGIKESGYGRELSIFGIREFVNIKTVYIKQQGDKK